MSIFALRDERRFMPSKKLRTSSSLAMSLSSKRQFISARCPDDSLMLYVFFGCDFIIFAHQTRS
jgi:hypothetical protein